MTEREIVVRNLTELKAAYTAADYEVPALLCNDLLSILEEWGTRFRRLAAVADAVFAEPVVICEAGVRNGPTMSEAWDANPQFGRAATKVFSDVAHEKVMAEAYAAVRAVLAESSSGERAWLDATVEEVIDALLELGWRLGA